jgi:multicomponent Na+:H+ antiporter subunit A
LFDAVASTLDVGASGKLALWPGVNTALVVSIVVVLVGAVVGLRVPLTLASRVDQVTGEDRNRFSGEAVYHLVIDGILAGAKKVTRHSQNGSLQTYVVVTMSMLAAVFVAPLVGDGLPDLGGLALADSWMQFVVVLVALVFTAVVTVTRHRFVAALLLGGVGLSLVVLFVLHGAPDLALTQLLVETVVLVVFLLVLRQLPRVFDAASRGARRFVHVAVSLTVGVAVAAFAVVVNSARTAPSVGEDYISDSLPGGGGKNVVNVILVDFRGFDTFGEITVLAVAALGVANLVVMARRRAITSQWERTS